MRPDIFRIHDFYVEIRNQRPEEHLKPTGNLDFSEKVVIAGHPTIQPLMAPIQTVMAPIQPVTVRMHCPACDGVSSQKRCLFSW